MANTFIPDSTVNSFAGNAIPPSSPTPTASAPASPIATDNLGKVNNPVTVPPSTPSSPTTPIATPPSGTTPDASGNATVPPPPKDTSGTGLPNSSTWADLWSKLTTKGDVTTQLQNDTQLADKTTKATASYNSYNQAKLGLQQKLESMHSQEGGTTGGNAQAIAVAEREGNANLANLAVIAQSDQGLLDAAQKTINDKLDAQFKPIQDQIDFLTKFNQINNNDLSDSEKEKLQIKTDQLKTEHAAVQTAVSDIHQTLLKNSAPASAYSAVDAITNKYINGTLSATDAQSQMYSAAAKYNTSTSGTYTPGANPTADAWISAVLNGNSTMASVPAAYKSQVALGLNDQPSTSYSPLAASKFATASNRISQNFINLPQYSLTANGLPYLQRIDAAIKTPGSISDQDLLDSLTKLNTAGNAISDAQVKLITDGKSFSDTMGTFANKFKNGGVLSDNQRTQIQTIAKSIFANYQKGYQPVYDQATSQLKAAGIPKAFWTIPDLNNLSAKAQGEGSAPKDGDTHVEGNVTYKVVNGAWVKQ